MSSNLEEPVDVKVKSYLLNLFNTSNSSNPATSTTYEFGSGLILGSTTPYVYIPITGTITRAVVGATVAGTLGTNESVVVAIKLNNNTSTTVTSALTLTAASQSVVNNSMTISVTAGDFITATYTTPSSFATPPTSVRINLYVFITPN